LSPTTRSETYLVRTPIFSGLWGLYYTHYCVFFLNGKEIPTQSFIQDSFNNG